jgi:DNA-binding response OmpR family regulator
MDPAALVHSASLAHRYLVKPCDPATLRATVQEAIRLRETAS